MDASTLLVGRQIADFELCFRIDGKDGPAAVCLVQVILHLEPTQALGVDAFSVHGAPPR